MTAGKKPAIGQKRVNLKAVIDEVTIEKKVSKKEKAMTDEKKGIKKWRSDVVGDLLEVQAELKTAVDSVSESVEPIHQKVMSLPLKYLGRADWLKDASADVQEVQEKTIGHIYDLFRTVNDKVDDVARDILKKAS